jgi:hypothetical protein
MKTHNQPTKEQVRHYLETRRTQASPPPSITEIRRQLGWTFMTTSADGGRGPDCSR